MRFDLVISDYDWTLGTSPADISEENLSAIREFIRKGGKFSVVTGRSFSSIEDICLHHGLKVVVGCFQGADIADLKTGKHLFTGGIDCELGAKAVSDLLTENYPVVAWSGDTLYYKEPSYYTEQYLGVEKVKLVQSDDVARDILKEGKPVSKVCAVTPEEKTAEFVKKYSEKYGDTLAVNSGAKRLVEIIKPELNKGFAVRYIANYLGVPLNKVMTVGDSLNDLELMSDDWYGVAVGDGDETLKKKAKEVTVPYTESAVAKLIYKYCL